MARAFGVTTASGELLIPFEAIFERCRTQRIWERCGLSRAHGDDGEKGKFVIRFDGGVLKDYGNSTRKIELSATFYHRNSRSLYL